MEICIIHFDGMGMADRLLGYALERHGVETAWLKDVTVIRRSARRRVSARPAGGEPSAERANLMDLERDVIRVVTLEDLLAPGSSALLLIAPRAKCDDMEAMFAMRSTRTHRHDVLADVDTTLHQLVESTRDTTSVGDE